MKNVDRTNLQIKNNDVKLKKRTLTCVWCHVEFESSSANGRLCQNCCESHNYVTRSTCKIPITEADNDKFYAGSQMLEFLRKTRQRG